MLSVKEIKDYFLLENSHAKKELGQNFLIDQKSAENIVNSLGLSSDDELLEIGPGLGALSEFLIGKTKRYVAVEYDEKFVNFLKMSYPTGIDIVKTNIVKYKDNSFNKVVGNLPYYMTSEILEFILSNFEDLKKGVFMVQIEALDRIMNRSGKSYGPLNALIAQFYGLKKEFIVRKSSFFPSPNVDSIVFSISSLKKEPKGYKKVYLRMLKTLFHNRRKTIQNNMLSFIKDKDAVNNILNEAAIEAKERPENISHERYYFLLIILLKLGFLHL
jgi:16S rRNA (adenine1518-N6/adenine1519-N6)-dimethyltransferase